MKNRIIAIVTLGSFLVFSWSCYSVQEIKPVVLAAAKPGDYEIRKIEKTSGETIEYSAKAPGDVRQGQITGTGTLLIAIETVEIQSAGLEIISTPGLMPMKVKTRDGKTYEWVKKIEERGDKSVLYSIVKLDRGEPFSLRVVISDIEKVWITKFDLFKTLAILASLGIFIGGCIGIFASYPLYIW